MKKYFVIAALFCFAISCDTNTECGTIYVENFIVDFVRFNNVGNLVNDPARSVWDSIYAENSLEAIYSNSDTALNTMFILPVNSNIDTLTYYFKKGDIWDTLKIKYRTGLRFKSPECGIIYEYRNLSIREHSFDSAWVVTDSLVRGIKNIEIIY